MFTSVPKFGMDNGKSVCKTLLKDVICDSLQASSVTRYRGRYIWLGKRAVHREEGACQCKRNICHCH